MSVSCECCVLSGRGLCDGLISRPEEFYRLWCVLVCDLETSWMRWPWPALGCCVTKTICHEMCRPTFKETVFEPSECLCFVCVVLRVKSITLGLPTAEDFNRLYE
jgi:hypothetical protein